MSVQEPEIPYGGTTAERLRAFAVNVDRERVAAVATKYWEVAAYGFLMVAAIILRFWNLGARALHHDESLHAYFGFGFNKGLDQLFTLNSGNVDTYRHVPFMHGPFQFIGNGFLMWIFNDGDYQSRLLAAILGSAMVGMPFLLRKHLGTTGALAAAAFICISPTLTYYSRFTREDIYTAFWSFGVVIFAWRYLATQKDYFLWLMAFFMAGLFLTKETSYMTVGGLVFFFDFLLARYLCDKLLARTKFEPPWVAGVARVGATLGLLFVGPLIVFGWIFLEDWRKKYDLDELPPEANVFIGMATLALPMYAAAIQEIPILFNSEWRHRNEEGINHHIANAEWEVAMISIFGLIGLSTALGLLWRPKTWAIAAAIFWGFLFLLSTTFFTNMGGREILGIPTRPDGFFSVVWGSLDYWLSQQDVRRGNQPDYYYFITIPAYEFLTLGLAVAGGLYYFIRGNLRNAAIVAACGAAILFLLLVLPHGPGLLKCVPPAGENPENLCPAGDARNGVSIFHVILPFSIALIGVLAARLDAFTRYLMFWLVLTSFGLTVAGEKMPWLNVHIALPLAVLAAKFVNDIVERTDLREDLPKLERLAPYAYAAAASALAILIFTYFGPFEFASAGAWLLAIVAGVAVYWAFTGYSPRTGMQVAAVAFIAAMSIFTLRLTVLSSWGHRDNPDLFKGDVAKRDHGEVPREMLVYTQTSGDIPVLMEEIRKAAKQSGLGENIPIVVDSSDGFTWPWAWYLRNYQFKKVEFRNIAQETNYTPTPGAILLLSSAGATKVQLGDGYGQGIPYYHRRWFPEEYRGGADGYSTRDFFKDLLTLKGGDWFDYWLRREPPAEIGHVDAIAFFPASYDLTPPPPVETARTEGTQLIIGGTGTRQGQLNGPSNVIIDGEGNLWVADTNNNRIAKYGPDGRFLMTLGGFGGEVSMNQPWSLAVADDGTVFVADTWNHKIVKFDKDGKKVHEWGAGGQTDGDGDGTIDNDDPFKLYGPRDIEIAPDGNVLITDTGNNRVIEYTADGEFVRQFGKKGSSGAPTDFTEPVGLEVAPNGDIYVGDMLNQRIVVLDTDLNLKREIGVDTWNSTLPPDKAYFELLDDGRLIVTDPFPLNTRPAAGTPQPATSDEPARLLIFGADGTLAGTFEMPKEGGAASARPIGISSDGTNVLVSDSIGNVIRRIPLAELTR
jgi:predicted membrane-bound mannosyltransferase/sugar lactone lactonase YvrE